MSKPAKFSNLVSYAPEKIKEYLKTLEGDLKRLFYSFTSLLNLTSLEVGDTTNYARIDSGGHFSMAGSATVWEDFRMPLTSTKLGSNSLPHFDETNVGYLFPSGTTAEKLYIVAQIPHSYKLGSKIFPHVHWSQGNSSNATFLLEYKWFDIAEGTTAGYTLYSMATTAMAYVTGTTMHQLTTNLAGISGAGISSVSSIMVARLSRNDTTYPGDALTYEFDIHYEQDTLGSDTELAK